MFKYNLSFFKLIETPGDKTVERNSRVCEQICKKSVQNDVLTKLKKNRKCLKKRISFLKLGGEKKSCRQIANLYGK